MFDIVIEIAINAGFILAMIACGYILGRLHKDKPKAELTIKDGQIINLNLDLDAVMENNYILMKITKLRN